jgi:hypothetical protein
MQIIKVTAAIASTELAQQCCVCFPFINSKTHRHTDRRPVPESLLPASQHPLSYKHLVDVTYNFTTSEPVAV